MDSLIKCIHKATKKSFPLTLNFFRETTREGIIYLEMKKISINLRSWGKEKEMPAQNNVESLQNRKRYAIYRFCFHRLSVSSHFRFLSAFLALTEISWASLAASVFVRLFTETVTFQRVPPVR